MRQPPCVDLISAVLLVRPAVRDPLTFYFEIWLEIHILVFAHGSL